jgi:hypothetical protein
MICKIAKKDLLLNLITFKFAVGTILCVVLKAVFVLILAKAYQERLKTYNHNVAYTEGESRKVTVYKNITPTIYRPSSGVTGQAIGGTDGPRCACHKCVYRGACHSSLSFPMVHLAGSDWICIGLMFLASLAFIAKMYNLGLLFSCLARRSAISLALGLLLWIIFVVVISN